MEPVTQRNPRDLDLGRRTARLVGWVVGSHQDQPQTIGDLLRAEGEDPQVIGRRILRTDDGKAELTNLLRRARLDGEACPDPETMAASILTGVDQPDRYSGGGSGNGALALVLIPSAIAGLALAGGLSPYLSVLIIAVGWYLGWRLLRQPGHDN